MATAPSILVVEDEMIVAEDLVETLRTLGYTICGTAASGEDAISKAMAQIPDIVLMDIMLRGEIDGIEAAKTIRGRLEVPIIFLTSFADGEVLNRAKLSEPFGYLTKPFAERELHASIEMALYRAQMEKRLKDSEARHRTLLQAVPDAVVVYNQDGKATFVNEGFRQMYGWSGEEFMSDGIDFVPAEEREATETAWDHVFSGENIEFETKRLTKAGGRLDIQLRTSVLRNQDGKVLEAVVVHRDITKRKMAERILRDAHKQLEERVQERTAELVLVNEELKEEIRQRILAEEAALREKENLERVFEAMEDGVSIVDQGYTIQYGNRSIQRDFGPVQSLKCYEYFHDRTNPCPKCHMKKVFERSAIRQEWISSKSEKTYELLDTVLQNPDGSLSKLEIFRDITERKEAQQALRESERRYRELVENAGDIVFQTDATGLLTFANMAAQKIMGYSEHEFLGKHYLEFVCPDHREEAEKFYAAQMRGRLSDTYYEFPLRTKTGKTIWLGQKVQLLRDGDVVRGLQAFTRDITERVQAEQALRKSEERFRELADLLPQFVYEIDGNGYFAFMNKAGLETIGCTWDDIRRGIKAADVFAGEDRDRAARNISEVMEGSSTQGNEYALQCRGGSLVPVMTYSSPIMSDGKVVGLRGVAIDVSRLKEMEAQLRHAQKMQAVGTLAGGIAHDFNNLLSPILMGAEMALDEVEDAECETREYLQEIKLAAERAADLVSQILVLSRSDESQARVIKLGSIVEESTRFLRSTLPATIAVRCEIKTDLDTIKADPTQIQQVLMNLGTNAAHAIGLEGGVLEMELDSVTPETDPACGGSGPASFVRLTVRDSGCGMTSEVRERVFEPYFTTKPPGEGSGLGLAIVHGIVQRNRGTINVESELGKGTKFTVYFPWAKKLPDEAGGSSQDIRRGNERILFVDDEPAIVAMACKMLKAMGYEVAGTSGGTEALERVRQEPGKFDLIITDMTMPEMTGRRLAELVLDIRPDMPVILTTGYSNRITWAEAEQIGICSIVFKPLSRREISDAIRKALDSRKED